MLSRSIEGKKQNNGIKQKIFGIKQKNVINKSDQWNKTEQWSEKNIAT